MKKNKKEENKEEKEIKKEHKFRKLLIKLIIFITIIIIGLIMYSKYIGTKHIIVKEYRVESNILTSNYNGIKIVHFSDLYYEIDV